MGDNLMVIADFLKALGDLLAWVCVLTILIGPHPTIWSRVATPAATGGTLLWGLGLLVSIVARFA